MAVEIHSLIRLKIKSQKSEFFFFLLLLGVNNLKHLSVDMKNPELENRLRLFDASAAQTVQKCEFHPRHR